MIGSRLRQGYLKRILVCSLNIAVDLKLSSAVCVGGNAVIIVELWIFAYKQPFKNLFKCESL